MEGLWPGGIRGAGGRGGSCRYSRSAGPDGTRRTSGTAGCGWSARTSRLGRRERCADLKWERFTDIQFDLNRADLRSAEAGKIERLATYLKQNPSFQVELEGFADPRGSQTHNMKLSTQRVNAVRQALIAQGVSQDRILVGAYGELNRKSAVTGEAAWQQDRRVEVIVLPMGAPATTSFSAPGRK